MANIAIMCKWTIIFMTVLESHFKIILAAVLLPSMQIFYYAFNHIMQSILDVENLVKLFL